MKKSIINTLLFLVILTMLSVFVSAEGWWNNDWSYRNELTINADKIDADIVDFPVLVYLSDANVDFNNINIDGSDLRFISNGVSLDYEIEKIEINNTWVWVRLSNVSSSVDTVFYVYYGNGNATDAQNPTGVWNSDFLTVQHLEDDPSSTIVGSTSNAHVGNPFGGMTIANQVDAVVGDGIVFDGSDDSIDFPGSIDPDNYNDGFSVSFWMRQDQLTNFAEPIMWDLDPGGQVLVVFENNRISYAFGAKYYSEIATFNTGEWYNFVIIHNNTKDRMYINGVMVHEASSGTLTATAPSFNIARHTTYSNYYLAGTMDELRVIGNDLSSEEVKAYYESDVDDLLDFGSIENGNLSDLAISNIVYEPANPYVNDIVQVNVTVTNLGFVPINSFDWIYDFDYGGESISVLNNGDEMLITLEHNYSYGGDYTFYFELDPFNNITELNETNNVVMENIFVNGTVDLIPSLVSLQRNKIDPRNVTFTVMVNNTGNMYIDGVSYNMDFGDFTGYGALISERINAEDFIIINVSHSYSDFGTYDIDFEIDNLSLIIETNESNNVIEDISYVERLFVDGLTVIGNTVDVYLYDWDNPFIEYALLASTGTTPGINLSDGRVIPLNSDEIFSKMRHNSSTLGFVNANSTLDSNGEAVVTWNIPFRSGYVGEKVYFAFVAYNGTMVKPDKVYSISSAIPVELWEY
ncbi:DUF2341 domain-containing protein [Candidatus Woesearchaeota archaeon]|nr:DUF2341 domain-containing protein [Candidatus Woesearchaeota archaeon]MBT6045141.1 DUF2341 domain-containing protein [Candidatus Woesearchaeota archaeon]